MLCASVGGVTKKKKKNDRVRLIRRTRARLGRREIAWRNAQPADRGDTTSRCRATTDPLDGTRLSVFYFFVSFLSVFLLLRGRRVVRALGRTRCRRTVAARANTNWNTPVGFPFVSGSRAFERPKTNRGHNRDNTIQKNILTHFGRLWGDTIGSPALVLVATLEQKENRNFHHLFDVYILFFKVSLPCMRITT